MDRSRSHLYQQAGTLLAGSAVVALIANAFHPRSTVGIDEAAASVADIDASAIWFVDHLAILAAVLGITIGLVALATDLATEERPRAWAWAAAVLAVVVGGFSAFMIVLDGIAMSVFASAADTTAATAIVAIELGAFAGLNLLMFGAVPMVLGMALVRSDTYPHAAGFVALAAGVLGIVTGVTIAITAEVTTFATVTFLAASLGLTLNTVWLGMLMRRHALEIAGHAATPTPA